MSVELNHTIIHAEDKEVSARFYAEILGLPEPTTFSHFLVLRTANGVSLDFMNSGGGHIHRQHYAFLVSEPEFDAIFERIRARGLSFWADPMGCIPDEINTHDGGRGFYFRDPSGHWLEVITRPYGSGAQEQPG